LNELVIFRCCNDANLWVLTLSRLSIIEGAYILHEPHDSDIGGSNLSGPMKSAPLSAVVAYANDVTLLAPTPS